MHRKFFTLTLAVCSLILGLQRFAQAESEDLDLLKFCQRSPLNSKCDGVTVPVSLEEREGIKVDCQLRLSDSDELEDCKYNVEGDTLTVYLESGAETEVLGDRKATQEIIITPENLLFFPTVANYKWKTNSTSLGLIELKLQSKFDIFFQVDSDSENNNRSNRLSIYFKNRPQDINPQKDLLSFTNGEKEQDLLSFLRANQQLNTDQQTINKHLENLRSPGMNISKSAAVEQLLETKSCVRCDLSGVDLTDADLENANLEGANLTNTNLTNVNLNQAYLLGASLQNTTLNNASFKSAELPYSSLNGANLQSAKFSATNLFGTNLVNANLSNVTIEKFTNLQTANLSNANLQETQLKGVDLRKANLTSANFSNSTIMIEKIFNSAKVLLLRSNFRYANLSNANLTNINAQGVIFNQANLSDASLVGGNFSVFKIKPQIKGNLLMNNSFVKTTLNRANLSDAQFNQANLNQANLQNVNLTNTNLEQASLIDADLSNAKVKNTQMLEANLNQTNLSGVNMVEANIEGATLCQTILTDGSISETSCAEEEEK